MFLNDPRHKLVSLLAARRLPAGETFRVSEFRVCRGLGQTGKLEWFEGGTCKRQLQCCREAGTVFPFSDLWLAGKMERERKWQLL